MLGAHLDSVPNGPEIQDNGSGSAAILEVALELADEFGVNEDDDENEGDDDDGDDDDGLRNAVRFAWWGAEEAGLVGSIHYVGGLGPEELSRIALYLNFDMIGSPNFVRFVYDGDTLPPGSTPIEQVFEAYFADQSLPTEEINIGARSDHFAFAASGIPVGGLFTGAEVLKTPEQAAIYGGAAGEPYDLCYHLACDTYDNISLEALDQNSDAIAHAVAVFAFDGGTVVDGSDDIQDLDDEDLEDMLDEDDQFDDDEDD
jgi:Zn-dependent M28 family amino/carboxypeptidase